MKLNAPRIIFGALLLSLSLSAQPSPAGETVIQPKVTLNIWPGVAPGSESAHQLETDAATVAKTNLVRNVVTPTLAVYLPEGAQATGTGIIILPGGGFVHLSMGHEGHDVARWLAARGIAAFVLKYRLIETTANGQPVAGASVAGKTYQEEIVLHAQPIADAIQSIRVVREHAAEWGVNPSKVGFLGFSAGGRTASAAMLECAVADRPNFFAGIYGAPLGSLEVKIPTGLPPMFLAVAGNDANGAYDRVMQFYGALRTAGYIPELHVFNAGKHGFGLSPHGTTSDHWVDEFYYWLQAQKLAKR